jgi:hypothetical protein
VIRIVIRHPPAFIKSSLSLHHTETWKRYHLAAKPEEYVV